MVACHPRYYKQQPSTPIPYPNGFPKISQDMAQVFIPSDIWFKNHANMQARGALDVPPSLYDHMLHIPTLQLLLSPHLHSQPPKIVSPAEVIVGCKTLP